MLTTETALPDLNLRLADAGFSKDRADLAVFWTVWRPWVELPVEGMDPDEDADMLLFGGWLQLREPGWIDRHSNYRPNSTLAFTRHSRTTPPTRVRRNGDARR